MPEKQPLVAYSVALSYGTGAYGTGALIVNTIVAPSPEAAVAMMTDMLYRQRIPTDTLTCVAVVPMTLEWLRWATRAVESGDPNGGRVLSLVQPPPAA